MSVLVCAPAGLRSKLLPKMRAVSTVPLPGRRSSGQRRPASCGEVQVQGPRVDRWVAFSGFVSRVRANRSATCWSIAVRGRPGRGSSRRSARNRLRHFETVSWDSPTRPVITPVDTEKPSSPTWAQPRIPRVHIAMSCTDPRRRTQPSDTERSSAVGSSGASLGPGRVMEQPYGNSRLRTPVLQRSTVLPWRLGRVALWAVRPVRSRDPCGAYILDLRRAHAGAVEVAAVLHAVMQPTQRPGPRRRWASTATRVIAPAR